MDSEAEIIIAFLFKRSGKTELKESEIYLPLSIELGWFSSQQAHNFVTSALKQNLLKAKGSLLTPTFAVENVAIPVGFYPSKTSFETEEEGKTKEEKKSVLDMIIQCISKKTNQNEKDLREKVKEIEEEKGILPEVATLVVAKEYDVDVEEYLAQVEHILLRENRK